MLSISLSSSSSTSIRCIAWRVAQRSTAAAASQVVLSQQCSSSSSALPKQQQHQQQQVRSLTSSLGSRSSYGRVRSYLRERRPVRQGEAVAFHINDLEKIRQVHQQPEADAATATAAAGVKKREYESDLIVILDMDECLIHSQFHANAHSAKVFAHQLLRSSSPTTNDATTRVSSQQVESFQFTLPSNDVVHTFLRPYVQEFLQEVSDKYETHIFTAAMPIYADPILNKLDPQNSIFAGRWYRDSCTYHSDPIAYVKNLQNLPLSLNMARTVLVDNNPLSFLANPANGILVNNFYQDANDRALPAVLQVLQQLDDLPDVRPTLEAKFGLEKALGAKRATTTTTKKHDLLEEHGMKKSTSSQQLESLAAV